MIFLKRDLKQYYSWLSKGTTNPIINTTVTGRCSMITGIFPNGQFLSLVVNDTGNTDRFWKFLKLLKYVIEFDHGKSIWDYIIALDNASIHWSKETTKLYKLLNLQVMHLPAYSLSLAPVDLFFRLVKNKLRRNIGSQSICFDAQKGRIEIFKSIENLREENIKDMWIHFILAAKSAITSFY